MWIVNSSGIVRPNINCNNSLTGMRQWRRSYSAQIARHK